LIQNLSKIAVLPSSGIRHYYTIILSLLEILQERTQRIMRPKRIKNPE